MNVDDKNLKLLFQKSSKYTKYNTTSVKETIAKSTLETAMDKYKFTDYAKSEASTLACNTLEDIKIGEKMSIIAHILQSTYPYHTNCIISIRE